MSEISRELLGKIVDEVFDGAIGAASVIEDIYRVIAREQAALAVEQEVVAWHWYNKKGEHEVTLHNEHLVPRVLDEIKAQPLYAAPVAAPVQVKALPTQKEMNQAFYVDVCRAEDRLNEIIELGKALLDSLPEHWHDDAVLNFKDAIDGVVVASSRRAVIQECIDVVETMGPDRLDGLMSRKSAIDAIRSLISGETSNG